MQNPWTRVTWLLIMMIAGKTVDTVLWKMIIKKMITITMVKLDDQLAREVAAEAEVPVRHRYPLVNVMMFSTAAALAKLGPIIIPKLPVVTQYIHRKVETASVRRLQSLQIKILDAMTICDD